MCEIVLNFDAGYRGTKLQVYQVSPVIGTGNDDYIVSRQLTSRTDPDDVQSVNRSEPFDEIRVSRPALQDVFSAVERVSLPRQRIEEFGCDGTWYAMRIKDKGSDRVIRWWMDIEPGLESIYELRDALVETVNRLLRSPR
jgi:hypothetical protein